MTFELRPIPSGYDLCPACKGTGQGKSFSNLESKYTWNKDKTHHNCLNCGGQTMGGTPKGYSKIDPATGTGCLHEFRGKNSGRCYTVYTCIKCTYSYGIDSGD